MLESGRLAQTHKRSVTCALVECNRNAHIFKRPTFFYYAFYSDARALVDLWLQTLLWRGRLFRRRRFVASRNEQRVKIQFFFTDIFPCCRCLVNRAFSIQCLRKLLAFVCTWYSPAAFLDFMLALLFRFLWESHAAYQTWRLNWDT